MKPYIKEMEVEKLTVKDSLEVNCVCFFLALTFVCDSFDVVGVVNIAGYDFRFAQLMALFVIIGAFIGSLKDGFLHIAHRDVYLIIWIALQFFFLFRSPDLRNAVVYFLWLVFDVAIAFSIVYHLNRIYSFHWLMRTYMSSFVYIAILGLVQFFLYLYEIDLFVNTRWTTSLARINGFSYEPSYYATYLIVGFILFAYMVEYEDYSFFSKVRTRMSLMIIVLALILTFSRMGYLMMIIYIIIRIIRRWSKVFFKGIKKKHLIFLLIGIPVFLLAIIMVIRYLFWTGRDVMSLFRGLGIFGQGDFSSGPRIKGLTTCLEIFMESPFFGYSLGGVDPMVAQYNGISYSTLYNGRAMSVIGEVAAASGIVGLIPLVFYLKELFFGTRKSVSRTERKKSSAHMALIWAFCFELVILCFNQNLLRLYVWCLIGVLSASWKELSK